MLRWKKSFDMRCYIFIKSKLNKARGRQGGSKWENVWIVYNKIIVMKKFSLVSNEDIRKHLANTSPAKVTHSFSKSRRFLDPNPEYTS